MRRLPRTYFDRTDDARYEREEYFCQQAVFAIARFKGADRRWLRAAQRDLAEARLNRRWRL